MIGRKALEESNEENQPYQILKIFFKAIRLKNTSTREEIDQWASGGQRIRERQSLMGQEP